MARRSIEQNVLDQYRKGAAKRLPRLCCPVSYDPAVLKVLPKEIIERDYGCGDPSRFLRKGDVVLDLGSGSGKICFIASQIVGLKGRVIGIDFNDEMLSLAQRYAPSIAERIGYRNVVFKKGKIQDLRLDLSLVERYLLDHPVSTLKDHIEFQRYVDQIRKTRPLVPSESIDIIVSNCVLNLVKKEDRSDLIREMHRVLKRHGRIAISDIVSDEKVPLRLQKNPRLWSGCISGAFQESEFMKAMEEANFYGIKIESYADRPFRIAQGIEFRSVTITAYKGKEGPCLERHQAVLYKGPWREVADDDGHRFRRGERTAVCDKTFHLMAQAPYAQDLVFIVPHRRIPYRKAKVFPCKGNFFRDPRITKNGRSRRSMARIFSSNGIKGEATCPPSQDASSCC